MKFPLVLAQGAEGIAVGLSTKILPHNFNELIDASIEILKGNPVQIFPDFPTGGQIDVSNYNDGERGGRVRVRAHIEIVDKQTLAIRDVPYGVTTSSLIDSIIKANDNGKIKIKRVVDDTAQEVEVLVELAPGTSPDVMIDALYAFTDCEVSISPNCCVIHEDKPRFMSVSELLKESTEHTLHLLKRELEIKKGDLSEKLFFASLEKIFIENRIYRDIEECETWESVIETIDKGLEPFKPQLLREVTEEDIIRLTEIKIKRISKYNSFKADELMRQLQADIDEVNYNLSHLTEYAIKYFESLKEKYGQGRERKTEIRAFDNIQVTRVAAANQKLYVNRQEGFIGYGLKKDEFVSECSDIDDIIVFRKDGKFLVTRISDKTFVGKDIIHVAVWKKGDVRMTYNMMYYDSKSGRTYAKRFNVTAVTRDREYDLTRGGKDSKVLYFSANPNSESEIVTVMLSPACKARKKKFEFDFGSIDIKGRGSQGNIVTKWPVRRVVQKEVGESTLGGIDVWYDPIVGRLNHDQRGQYLGKFDSGDLILVLTKDGNYELTGFDLTNRYDPDNVAVIEKFNPETVISAVHYDGESKNFYVKRFKVETKTTGKLFPFINSGKKSRLVFATTQSDPVIELEYLKGRPKKEFSEKIKLNDLVDIKGWKARGNRLSRFKVTYVGLANPENEEEELPPEVKGSVEQLSLFDE
jgi:topoisomerase-4 subunit A